MIDLVKNVTRNTKAPYRDKTIVVRLTPGGVLVKLSGQRWARGALAPYEAIYDMAYKLLARTTEAPPRRVKRGLLRR